MAMKPFHLVILAAGLLNIGSASADVLSYPTDSEAAAEQSNNMPLPERGLTMTQVESRYGEPSQRHAPVPPKGNWPKPPIIRWDYVDFSVFFERDKVIHSVRPDHPPRIESDE